MRGLGRGVEAGGAAAVVVLGLARVENAALLRLRQHEGRLAALPGLRRPPRQLVDLFGLGAVEHLALVVVAGARWSRPRSAAASGLPHHAAAGLVGSADGTGFAVPPCSCLMLLLLLLLLLLPDREGRPGDDSRLWRVGRSGSSSEPAAVRARRGCMLCFLLFFAFSRRGSTPFTLWEGRREV